MERKKRTQILENLMPKDRERPTERKREREKRKGRKEGCLAHYTAVIYSSSFVLFSGIKTGCKFDS